MLDEFLDLCTNQLITVVFVLEYCDRLSTVVYVCLNMKLVHRDETFYLKQQFITNVYFLVVTSQELSSVARGGLEPPHWLVKYAKSHVFGAFEADFR